MWDSDNQKKQSIRYAENFSSAIRAHGVKNAVFLSSYGAHRLDDAGEVGTRSRSVPTRGPPSASTKRFDRGEAYAKAGADVIFIESPETVEEMLKIGKALSVPLGGRTPILPQSQLQEMGFSVAIYPTAGLLAASHGLASVYASLAKGKPVEAPRFGEFAAQGQI